MFEQVQWAGDRRPNVTKETQYESLRRRFRKRLQLEWRKFRSGDASLISAMATVFFGALTVMLLVVLVNKGLGWLETPHVRDLSSLPKQLTVIVPTYKELDNITPLTERVLKATGDAGLETELILVDDNSQDGSVEKVLELQNKGYNVTIIVRKKERGLSSAVLTGMQHATYSTMLVMDADLSHPPEVVPAVALKVMTGEADFSLGSRYVHGGGTQDWPLIRRIISWGATVLARPLVSVSDPMSGFFAIRKSLLDEAHGTLNPLGFKIALELMVKCAPHNVVEVPYTFTDRLAGQSKLKFKTQIQYLRHLLSLYWYMYPITTLVVFALAIAVVVAMATYLASRSRRAADLPMHSKR